MARFVQHADIVKISAEDLGLLYPGAIAEEIAADWLRAGAGLVVVTRGEGGAEAYTASDRSAVPGRSVRVVDTVGAGDTFQAALVAGLAERGVRTRKDLDALAGSRIAEIVAFAVSAAAITCTRRGADLPRRSELPAMP
jgi:fructokinase